jgi:hypothetical protein
MIVNLQYTHKINLMFSIVGRADTTTMQTVWELETKEPILPETTPPEVTSLSAYLETSTMSELELTVGEGAEPYHASNRDEEIFYLRDFLSEKNQGE